MTGSEQLGVRPVVDLNEIGSGALVGFSTSLKPGRSASRALLVAALSMVRTVAPETFLIDLRDHPAPMFEGVGPEQLSDPTARYLSETVTVAGALLLCAPAYWAGVSGVFKNLVDVLCGASYDLETEATTVFKGKPTGLVVVGADDHSARAGATQAEATMRSVGAELVGSTVKLGDPRSPAAAQTAVGQTVALAAELARVTLLRRPER